MARGALVSLGPPCLGDPQVSKGCLCRGVLQPHRGVVKMQPHRGVWRAVAWGALVSLGPPSLGDPRGSKLVVQGSGASGPAPGLKKLLV